MKNTSRALAIGLVVLGMGITMPSCPGQQAMQQQIDTLQNNVTDLTRRLSAMENQVKTVANEHNGTKEMLGQAQATVLAQKAALDQLDASVKALDAKVTELAARAAATAPKRQTKLPTKKKGR